MTKVEQTGRRYEDAQARQNNRIEACKITSVRFQCRGCEEATYSWPAGILPKQPNEEGGHLPRSGYVR